jgi:hypothetical protein
VIKNIYDSGNKNNYIINTVVNIKIIDVAKTITSKNNTNKNKHKKNK